MPFKICGKVWGGYGVGSMQGIIFHIEKLTEKFQMYTKFRES